MGTNLSFYFGFYNFIYYSPSFNLVQVCSSMIKLLQFCQNHVLFYQNPNEEMNRYILIEEYTKMEEWRRCLI